jgi:lactoylglutathione lyase
MVEMASLVLFSAAMDDTVAFYRAIGLELDEEDHGDGPVHFATDVDGVHFAVFGAADPGHAPAWQHAGSVFAGFYVASLADTVAAVQARGAPVLVEHQVRPWGCRAVVADPDGRPVEINQRDHCSEVADTGP